MQVIIDGVEYAPKVRVPAQGTLGEYLRTARKAARLSLDKAASQIGCGKSSLWDLEQNGALPSLKMAAQVAAAYGLSLDDMAARMGGAA